MNFLLLSAVIYCLSCVTQAYTAADLNALCTNVAAVQPHPYRCDAFLSCVPAHTGFKAVEMACPPNLMFDLKASVCNWPFLVTCDQACTDGDKFKAFYACDTYFECTNNKFNPKEKKCAPGESFDATTKTCVTDASCGDPIVVTTQPPPPPCSDSYRMSATPGEYEQLVNNNWVTKLCPVNSGFNMATCSCEHIDNGAADCSTIAIPFSSDTSDTYGSNVENVNVQVSGGYGVFDGTGYLTLPSTTNVDYGDNFEVQFTFNAAQKVFDRYMALFGNTDCIGQGYIYVTLRDPSNLGDFDLYISVGFDDDTYESNTIPDRNINTDYTLKITRQGQALNIYLNGIETVLATIPGKIAPTTCPYYIGQTEELLYFTGKIKDFHISKCLIEEKIVLG